MENELIANLFEMVEYYRLTQKRNMWTDNLYLDIVAIWLDW